MISAAAEQRLPGRGEVDSVVGEHGVDLVRHGCEQGLEEVGCYALCGFFMHLDVDELGGAVDGDQQIKPALLGADLGDVDMKVADRVGLELLAPRLIAVDLWQPGDIVPLQAAVQRGPCQLRERGL